MVSGRNFGSFVHRKEFYGSIFHISANKISGGQARFSAVLSAKIFSDKLSPLFLLTSKI